MNNDKAEKTKVEQTKEYRSLVAQVAQTFTGLLNTFPQTLKGLLETYRDEKHPKGFTLAKAKRFEVQEVSRILRAIRKDIEDAMPVKATSLSVYFTIARGKLKLPKATTKPSGKHVVKGKGKGNGKTSKSVAVEAIEATREDQVQYVFENMITRFSLDYCCAAFSRAVQKTSKNRYSCRVVEVA